MHLNKFCFETRGFDHYLILVTVTTRLLFLDAECKESECNVNNGSHQSNFTLTRGTHSMRNNVNLYWNFAKGMSKSTGHHGNCCECRCLFKAWKHSFTLHSNNLCQIFQQVSYWVSDRIARPVVHVLWIHNQLFCFWKCSDLLLFDLTQNG